MAGGDRQAPHVQDPQPHPPEDSGPEAVPADVPATNEKRRRTRSLPHEGQVSAVSTVAVIDRRSSKWCSHAMHRYSYAAIARRIPAPADGRV